MTGVQTCALPICFPVTIHKARLNTDIRKKIGGLIQSHFENEQTTELENFKSAKEDIDVAYSRAFKLATTIVQRAYPKDDVATLNAFKKKYGSACDVVAKDSCFYFANTEMKKPNDSDDNVAEHFNFKLDASMNGRFDSMDFGIAYYRDELKQVGINPEITIQNKHKTIVAIHIGRKKPIRLKNFLGIKTRMVFTRIGKINFPLM